MKCVMSEITSLITTYIRTVLEFCPSHKRENESWSELERALAEDMRAIRDGYIMDYCRWQQRESGV